MENPNRRKFIAGGLAVASGGLLASPVIAGATAEVAASRRRSRRRFTPINGIAIQRGADGRQIEALPVRLVVNGDRRTIGSFAIQGQWDHLAEGATIEIIIEAVEPTEVIDPGPAPLDEATS